MEKQNTTITVITPTYNRVNTLEKLYVSLCNQTDKEFEWLVVDDGSKDKTKELIDKYVKENLISIRYIYQENGGKHRALNTGIKIIDSELTFIVDSDDYLTKDAIETIKKEWDRNNGLCGISYLRGFSETEQIGDKFEIDYAVDTYHNIRLNHGINGDKAEVWRTDLLRNEPFYEVEGERFFGEGYVWVRLSKQYPMLFRNKIIYITEYMEGGLTKSGRKLRIKCPIGGMVNSNELITKELSLRVRIKNSWLYCAYGFFARKTIKEMVSQANNKLIVKFNWPFGFMLYLYWKKKFL